MTNADLDDLLASHHDIVPSSGFADAVMAAVRHEAWKRPPLRFPWARAALGPLVAVPVAVVFVGSGFVRPATGGSGLPGVVTTGEMLSAIAEAASRLHLAWMMLALLLTLASVGLSSHLASRAEEHF
jgi:hypothetical protein